METFSNNAVGNLNASILIGATSLVLQAGQGALFPATGNFRIVIGTEIIIVGARSGDTLSSLTRGAESTAAAAHNSADVVTHELTAGALSTFTSGQQVDYTEVTSNQTSTATTSATATAVVTGSAVAYDGSTAVLIEFFCGNVLHSVSGKAAIFSLYDGATELGIMGRVNSTDAAGIVMFGRRRLTPTNASHTYSIRVWTTSAGTVTCGANNGVAAGFDVPMSLRITKA